VWITGQVLCEAASVTKYSKLPNSGIWQFGQALKTLRYVGAICARLRRLGGRRFLLKSDFIANRPTVLLRFTKCRILAALSSASRSSDVLTSPGSRFFRSRSCRRRSRLALLNSTRSSFNSSE
jgi:hypothetical protein